MLKSALNTNPRDASWPGESVQTRLPGTEDAHRPILGASQHRMPGSSEETQARNRGSWAGRFPDERVPQTSAGLGWVSDRPPPPYPGPRAAPGPSPQVHTTTGAGTCFRDASRTRWHAARHMERNGNRSLDRCPRERAREAPHSRAGSPSKVPSSTPASQTRRLRPTGGLATTARLQGRGQTRHQRQQHCQTRPLPQALSKSSDVIFNVVALGPTAGTPDIAGSETSHRTSSTVQMLV